MDLKAILFDFDDTLQVGTMKELHARLEETCKNLGMTLSSKEIHEFAKNSDFREMKKLIIQAHNDAHSNNQITDEMFQKANNKISGKFDSEFRLADGALDLLKMLKAKKYKIGLVTTRGISLPRLLEFHGIKDYFDVIIARNDAKECKPHPQPIAYALEKLGVAGNNSMYVGDKQVDDIIAGKALNMKTVLINENKLDKYGAIPDYHFSSLRELINLFG